MTCKPKAGVIINHSHKSSFRSGATGYNNEEMASFMFAGYLPLSLGEGGWFPIQGRQAFYQAKRGIWFLNSCELRRKGMFYQAWPFPGSLFSIQEEEKPWDEIAFCPFTRSSSALITILLDCKTRAHQLMQ